MARMTEEEAWALDDYVTNNEITLGPNGSGWLSRRENNPWGLESKAIKYILEKSIADHKLPAQIINELINEKIASASV